MSSNNPYFIRHQLGDSPGNNGGSFSSCPDIIFSTTGAPNWTPISTDPQTYLTAASYGTDYGSTIQVSAGANVDNFVYLRALNTNPSANIPTRLWLMYAECDLALWPQNWRRDNIKISGEVAARNWQDGKMISSGGPGPYIVTGQPFLWSPTPPNSGTHYCVIAMTEPFPGATPPGSLSDPPFAPPSSIGYMNTFDQLVQFILGNDWFGWRNTIDVSSLGATWQQTIPVTGPDQGGQVYVGLACSNMPTDGFVSAYMRGPDTANTLNIPKTAIATSNMNVTVPLTLPDKYKTDMIITYWQGATNPPYMASVAPVLMLPSAHVETLLAGRRANRAPRYFQVQHPVTRDALGWQRMHVFGSVPLAWDTPPPRPKGSVAVPQQLSRVLGAVKDPGATWQKTYPISLPQGGQFQAGFHCFDLPLDGRIAIDVSGPSPATSVQVPPIPIVTPNQLCLVALAWPAGAEGSLTISYWQGPTQPPASARIDPLLLVADDTAANASALHAMTASPPTLEQKFPVQGPDEAALVYVGVRCSGLPSDGMVAFTLDPPGNVGVPATPIANSEFMLGCAFSMPAKYRGNLNVSYWRGATPPPAAASILPFLTIPAKN